MNKERIEFLFNKYFKSKPISLWEKTEILTKIDNLCFYYIENIIRNLYLDKGITKPDEILHCVKSRGLKKLVEFFLLALETKGIISLLNGHIEMRTSFVKDRIYQNTLQEIPEYKGIVELIRYCYEHYPNVLQCSKSGLEILFPDGTHNFTRQKIYLESAVFTNVNYFVPVIAELMSCQEKQSKVIEIGGGAGELTWKILPLMTTKPKEYLFTDIGRGLVIEAKKYALDKYPFVNFEILDIEKQIPAEKKEQFNTVIAYNVVHATKNIFITLSHLMDLLIPGGYLLLVEVCAPFMWQYFTWGMLEGMWAFDDDFRTNTAMLSIRQWQKAIKACGFNEIFAYPNHDNELNKNDMGMIVCQK